MAPPRIMPAQVGRIVSLTYHEITADPRVMKEARALKAAGYDVHVYCDWPDGLPQHDEIDGIHITRFRCFGMERVTAKAFHDMWFLRKSKEAIAERYLPYADACETISRLEPWLVDRFGPEVLERMQSSYYKSHVGPERHGRRLSYLWLNLRLRLGAVGRAREHESSKCANPRWKLMQAHRTFKHHKHKLFQAQSVSYWSSFDTLDIDYPVLAVHAHDIYCLPTGVMLANQFGAPLIYDAHEYEPGRATNMAPDANQLPELIENDCFPYVDRMITVSESIADLYAERYDGKRPTVVMNSPELGYGLGYEEGSHGRVVSVREQVGLSAETPLVVFTGGIQREHRGMDKVLQALVHLPGVFLAILGPRHSANDGWFEEMASRLGVADRVRLLPPVDARDVPATISSADVSICAFQDVSLNHRFAMPNKLFEAAFANVPICVSDLPEMRRFVETLGAGRVMDQTDPYQIAEALLDTIQNRDRYCVKLENLRKLNDTYSWSAQARKLIEMYCELLYDPRRIRSAILSEASPSP